ncbi:NAD(P)/FAD-dependent oxidoreductase [Pseudarthrobacter phenanthrenivorans]|uniref:NAD(P)/FAD-dependent oxidoreductase n=1 Tax=Pseudarthrobacter phenanthrenivorans TaxID=361575 RepID=UPI00112BBD36|nr:NAD(P)/FAD-dependent oxidoreductase [Pseudarthrobacter phenanthrenivorans]TPV50247.1 NAD(P)/FAD-dependent oxidoreductase [Pseudarthrobacter phenanthrenivorans]
MTTNKEPIADVLIIGGGAAGLSAAQMLGRCRRSVTVVDNGQPRNAPAQAVHGFLSRDGINPAELLAVGRAEARQYGAVIVRGTVLAAGGNLEQGFEVTLDDGTPLRGRRLLVATGLVDELPAIEGLPGRWGKDILHCPFCHGWEVQDQAIGVVGSGPWSVHQALLFRQWSSNITLFLNDKLVPADADAEQLAARGVKVVAGRVEAVRVEQRRLRGIALAGGPEIAVDAVVVGPIAQARLEAFAGLGLVPSVHPAGVGTYLETDADGATSVPGVWAAGNVTDLKAQVLASAATAAWTAVVINNHLMAEETAADVRAYREKLTLTGA